MIATVTRLTVLEPYRLSLEFDDGIRGEVDITKLVAFEGVFAPLRDPVTFAKVRLDDTLGTIVWPNGADIDPFVLYEKALGRTI